MLHTENYQLNKPEANEKVNISLLNENMDIIDQNLSRVTDTAEEAKAAITTFESNALLKNDAESTSYLLDFIGNHAGESAVTDRHIIETVNDDINNSDGTLWNSIQAKVEGMIPSNINTIYYTAEEPSECENGALWLTNAT